MVLTSFSSWRWSIHTSDGRGRCRRGGWGWRGLDRLVHHGQVAAFAEDEECLDATVDAERDPGVLDLREVFAGGILTGGVGKFDLRHQTADPAAFMWATK